MMAREISVGGCLFLLFFLGLFIVFNVPLQNILMKVFPKNDIIITIIEVCLFFILARILAHLFEPGVIKYLEESTRYIADALVDMLGH